MEFILWLLSRVCVALCCCGGPGYTSGTHGAFMQHGLVANKSGLLGLFCSWARLYPASHLSPVHQLTLLALASTEMHHACTNVQFANAKLRFANHWRAEARLLAQQRQSPMCLLICCHPYVRNLLFSESIQTFRDGFLSAISMQL